jgi:hypothetical protein
VRFLEEDNGMNITEQIAQISKNMHEANRIRFEAEDVSNQLEDIAHGIEDAELRDRLKDTISALDTAIFELASAVGALYRAQMLLRACREVAGHVHEDE